MPGANLFQCILRSLIHLFVVGLAVWLIAFAYYITGVQLPPGDRFAQTALIFFAITFAITGAVACVVVAPTFVASQILWGVALFLWCRRRSAASTCGLAAVVFPLSWLSFTCYDWLVPSYRWYTDLSPGWVHGVTPHRMMVFIGLQSCLAAFTFWRIVAARSFLFPACTGRGCSKGG